MRRREFVVSGGASAAWLSTAHSQEPARRIGALLGGDEKDAVAQSRVDAFRAKLRQLGWTEGRNAQIDWRWAANDHDRAQTYALQLIGLKPEVIFCANTIAIAALKQTMTTIPIVFASVTDPVANGYVGSLARPGANITGFSDREPEMGSKLPEFLKEVAPHLTRVAIIINPATNSGALVRHIQVAAISLRMTAVLARVNDVRELEDSIVSFAREPNSGLVIPADIFTETHRDLIIALAARHRMPTIYAFRSNVVAGGLISYGVDQLAQYAGAAGYVDRILKGTRPSELPVQLPVKYELVINLKTAKALGVDIPLKLHAFADEVIE